MKIQDIRQKSDDELRKTLYDLQKDQLNLRFQAATAELDSSAKFRQIRRSIARVKTIINERKQ